MSDAAAKPGAGDLQLGHSVGGAAPPIPHLISNQLPQLAEQGIELRVHERVARLRLNNPQRHNPQTPHLWLALAQTAAVLEGQVDLVVISAAGASFSAGLDRRAFTREGIPGQPGLFDLALAPAAEADAVIASYQAGFRCWREASFLSLAVVQGHAIGAGFQLALAADLRLAADDASFVMKEPQLGLVPDLTGTQRLVEAVGYAAALDICARGAAVDAATALRLGLVQRVVARSALEAATEDYIRELGAGNQAAVRATKQLLARVGTHSASEQYAAERAAQWERLRALAQDLGG